MPMRRFIVRERFSPPTTMEEFTPDAPDAASITIEVDIPDYLEPAGSREVSSIVESLARLGTLTAPEIERLARQHIARMMGSAGSMRVAGSPSLGASPTAGTASITAADVERSIRAVDEWEIRATDEWEATRVREEQQRRVASGVISAGDWISGAPIGPAPTVSIQNMLREPDEGEDDTEDERDDDRTLGHMAPAVAMRPSRMLHNIPPWRPPERAPDDLSPFFVPPSNQRQRVLRPGALVRVTTYKGGWGAYDADNDYVAVVAAVLENERYRVMVMASPKRNYIASVYRESGDDYVETPGVRLGSRNARPLVDVVGQMYTVTRSAIRKIIRSEQVQPASPDAPDGEYSYVLGQMRANWSRVYKAYVLFRVKKVRSMLPAWPESPFINCRRWSQPIPGLSYAEYERQREKNASSAAEMARQALKSCLERQRTLNNKLPPKNRYFKDYAFDIAVSKFVKVFEEIHILTMMRSPGAPRRGPYSEEFLARMDEHIVASATLRVCINNRMDIMDRRDSGDSGSVAVWKKVVHQVRERLGIELTYDYNYQKRFSCRPPIFSWTPTAQTGANVPASYGPIIGEIITPSGRVPLARHIRDQYPEYMYAWPDGTLRTTRPPEAITSYHSSRPQQRRLYLSDGTVPVSITKGDDTCVGIELEVEYVGNKPGGREACAIEVRRMLHETYSAQVPSDQTDEGTFFTERDGSISNGFEIITSFGPIQTMRNLLWEVFRPGADGRLPFVGRLISHNTGTCGLHVHLDAPASLLHSVRLVEFYNRPDNRPLIELVSRRWGSSYAKASRVDVVDIIHQEKEGRLPKLPNGKPDPKYGLKHLKQYVRQRLVPSRYGLINTTPQKTVEVRAFRGTLQPVTLLACVEFAYMTWKFCRINSDMSTPNFTRFICEKENLKDSKYLRAYLIARGMKIRPTKTITDMLKTLNPESNTQLV